LIVNVAGSLTIGLLAGLSEGRELLTPSARLFLFTGLLGGFTTFSALALESVTLATEGVSGKAALSVVLQVVLGLGAAWIAYVAGQQI
jgi:CrcB protein